MNANELANKLETAKSISEVAMLVKENVIPMLRQQQAEIEALKKQVDVFSKAFETACDGMQTSLELNKAQAERYWGEKK